MNRGAHHGRIFRGLSDKQRFLDRMQRLEARHGLEIRAYALMPNHFHLLARSERGELSAAMAYLQGPYAQRTHYRDGLDGPMFRARFKSRLVDDRAYWAHLVAYIHLNPARLGPGLVDNPLWTSHTPLMRGARWLHAEATLASLGGRDIYLGYLDGVRQGRLHGPSCFDAAKLWSASPTDRELRELSGTLSQRVRAMSDRGAGERRIARLLDTTRHHVQTLKRHTT